MTPEQAQQILDRLAKLEAFVGSINKSDRIVFDKSVQFRGSKTSFYGNQLLGQQGVSPMTIGTVNGTPDDATINSNFSSIRVVWDELRLGLIDLGLFTG